MATGTIAAFQDCLSSEVKGLGIQKGTLIFCRDSGECWYDTLEGTRIRVAHDIKIYDTDTQRQQDLFPDTDLFYIVRNTAKLWIYNNGWVCLNAGGTIDTTVYFDILNCDVPTGNTGATFSDSRINTKCTATFVPDISMIDLFGTATCTCSDGSVKVVLSNTNYPMVGTVQVKKNITITY